MEWKLELSLWTRTILTRGSEFHMDWISWSQIWSTKSTTTTSRRLLRRSRKIFRWKRMCLLLQADQRLKQNHEDIPLLAHLQELCLLDERNGFRSSWKQQGHPTNPTNTKNSIIKNKETRGWATVHPGDRKRCSKKMLCLVAKAPNTQQERWDPWMDQNQSCVSMLVKIEEEDQTRTGRPVGGQESTSVEELDIHWLQSARIVTCSCERSRKFPRFRARQEDRKSSSSREAFQADLQQSNVYNPFSNNSKEIIRELGNVELFELCETVPKVQCSRCLLYWNQGMICCTCEQFLVESESRRKFHKLRLDALSIPHYVIKKGRCQSTRKNWRTERVPYSLECVEEMLQKSWLSKCTLQRYSRPLSQRPSLSWITTPNWLDRAKVHRDGRTGKTKSHVPLLYRGIQEIPRTMVSHRE